MKKNTSVRLLWLMILSLSSLVLVSSCVTVKAIDKKDNTNNQFSLQLKDWFYIKHPPKFDTSTTVEYDTTQDPNVQVDTTWSVWDSLSNKELPFAIPKGKNGVNLVFGNVDSLYWVKGEVIHKDTIILTRTITRTVTRTVEKVVDHVVKDTAELGAYKRRVADDLTIINKYVIAEKDAKNRGLKYLIWAIIATGLLGIVGYFNIRKLIV